MKKIFAIFLLFIFSSQSLAQDGKKSDQVKKFVDEIGNKIVAIANEKTTSELKKKEKIIAVVDSVIDPEWIARFVLGKNYKTASDPQRQRFTKLYRDFMINTYGPKFRNYNGRRFDVLSVDQQNSFYIAKAEFLPRDSNIPISVNFRVKDRGDKLVILDFVAEGVSLIETQRSEFNSAISEKGMNKFLDDLTVRVVNLKKSGGKSEEKK
jgi:phospholipid transport system substrate-binding protein